MKNLVATIALVSLIAPVAPAAAASPLADSLESGTRFGAFAGARLRLSLGGGEKARPRIGLTLAPTQQSFRADGRQRLRFGEGLELGFTGREATARVGGYSLTGGGEAEPGKTRMGVSTIGAAGIAAGVIVAGLVIYAFAVRPDSD